MNFERSHFLSSDGKNNIAYYMYYPEKPKAVIQLSHGMCEYVERYEPHAKYFCDQGFAFCGNDHLGHGASVSSKDDYGYTVSADCLIDDVHKMTLIIREKFPNVPVVLLGHSMGSFVARCYMSNYPDEVDGFIISGTAGPESPTGIAKLLAKASIKLHGGHYRDKLLVMLSTGNYDKKFGKDAPRGSWLSGDNEIAKKYYRDDRCNYTFTSNGYYNMFDLLNRVSRKSWAVGLKKDAKCLLISGEDDPVGAFGKGVRTVHSRMIGAGMTNVTLKMYEKGRHELFNEVEPIRTQSYEAVVEWMNENIMR